MSNDTLFIVVLLILGWLFFTGKIQLPNTESVVTTTPYYATTVPSGTTVYSPVTTVPSDSGTTTPVPCIDSDGNDIFTKGYVSYMGQTVVDTCFSLDYVNENLCPIGSGLSSSCFQQMARCYDGECFVTYLDEDGDGYTNQQEIEGGSDPRDSNSHPFNDDPCVIQCENYGYGYGWFEEFYENCGFYFYVEQGQGTACCCSSSPPD